MFFGIPVMTPAQGRAAAFTNSLSKSFTRVNPGVYDAKFCKEMSAAKSILHDGTVIVPSWYFGFLKAVVVAGFSNEYLFLQRMIRIKGFKDLQES